MIGLRLVVLLAVATLVAGCAADGGAPPTAGTQVVVRVVDGAVVLTPEVVPAGRVRFVVEDGGSGAHSAFEFVSRSDGTDCPPCDAPPPLVAGDIERLRLDAAPQGLGHDSGWGPGVELELRPGEYAFVVPGPGGGMPGTPPASLTVLTVRP